LSIEEYFAVVAERTRYRERFVELMEERRLDAIICPPYPLPSLPHGSSADADLQLAEIACAVFNIVGLPAGVVSASRVGAGEDGAAKARGVAATIQRGSEGLPVGVQVAARHWRDDIVLALMHALEEHFRALPSYPATPPVVSAP
jgi:fatty acid amide hydrolase